MINISFPKMVGKHRFKPFYNPEELLLDVPVEKYRCQKAIFVYSSDILNKRLIRELRLREIKRFIYGCKGHYINKKGSICMLFLAIGAPITAIAAEMLASIGVKEFLILGTAGGISKRLSLGDIVLCTKAVRDEGTSHHYIDDSVYSYPEKELIRRLEESLKKHRISFVKGPTWTIDALFRETRKEVEYYGRKGVLTVEMEASALFAVAQKRGVKAAAVFVVSDLLVGKKETKPYEDSQLSSSYSDLVVAVKDFADNQVF